MSHASQAFIGTGSNLGDRAKNIRRAVERLNDINEVFTTTLSPLYESPPVGVTDQPKFLNAVIGLETSLTPESLMAALLQIEREMGRIRRERWGPRLIDLDLLLFETETRSSENLTLPHPRFRERSFVTMPLLDLLGKPPYDRPRWRKLAEELSTRPADPTVRRWNA